MEFNELNNLREAIKATPDNVPLRKLYINALTKAKRYEEASVEIKETLRLAPKDASLKVWLATVYHQLKKTSLGLVVIEEVISSSTPPADAWLVYAKLLFQGKSYEAAKDAYQKAIIIDASLKDNFLESDINLQLQKNNPPEPEKLVLGNTVGPSGEDSESSVEIERPKITFKDVGGMDTLKEEIRMKIIAPLEHPEIYKAYGKKIGGGILMYGPPGCGKTHLARATAGEVNANFISVGISDILDMYIGNSERNLHAIFQKARQMKPCVLFFDEVDALGASRTDMRNFSGRHVINQFLSEMDGVEYDNEGVLILAATNAPWHLDSAFRRPGRFDRIIFVPPPDDMARQAILKIKLEGKPVKDLRLDKLMKRTTDFSGADLEAVIDIAIEAKLEEAMRKGVPQPIITADLVNAAKKHRPTTKEWFQTAKNYALFANEAGLYDDILAYLKL
ncbi:MAG: AAA family ATPase [Bacteroidota bacterium]